VNNPNPSLKQRAKNTDCADDFRQQVAMFVVNVSNPLFSQVSMLQTDTKKQTSSGNVQNLQLLFGSPLRDPFFDPSLSFDPYFGNHRARSTYQPFCVSCGNK